MAWVAQGPDGRVLGVSFNRDSLDHGDAITHLQIDDHTATDILQGKITVQSVAQTLRPSTDAEQCEWNQRYPSLMSEADVDTLIALARSLPRDAVGVEIGSRLGGSSRIWLDHAPALQRLYSIDSEWADPRSPGIREPWMQDLNRYWGVDAFNSCYLFAASQLSAYPNSRMLSLSSPYDLAGWWTETIDFLYEDSSHVNPQLRDTLEFWVPLVRPGGIIAGHDYDHRWYPDITAEVDALAKKLNTTLNTQGKVWWMQKPLADVSADPAWVCVEKLTLDVKQIAVDRSSILPLQGCEILPIQMRIASKIMDGAANWLGQSPVPYPALMHRADLLLYRRIASMVPSNGTIMEVGSRWGGSAKGLLDVLDPSINLHCVDIKWKSDLLGPNNPLCPSAPKEEWITQHWGMNAMLDSMTAIDWIRQFLSEHPNVTLHAAENPNDMSWWSTPLDMLFEDAWHWNPQLRTSLDFWVPWVKSGGIIAGHDYKRDNPDVIKEADSLAQRLGTTLQRDKTGELETSTVWWMIKP